MKNDEFTQIKTRTAGQVVFAVASLVISLFLLSQIANQTEWNENARNIAAQPRLWPAIALTTMVIGFALHWWLMKQRRPNPRDWIEVHRWAEPVEYLLWFLAYVFAVPRLGFLPMSLLVACALTWRLGYRNKGAMWAAAGFAIAVTALFKGFLGVNIPGGQIYEFLPGSVRTFFLVYL